MTQAPLALVTNDDGIDSAFLQELVKALSAHFRIVIAAPSREQSWIGRAMSRHKTVRAEATEVAGYAAWSIDGTPSDCINLALGQLLQERPRLVVSGINLGHNTSVPLLYSSGTIAGALEGAHWGLPGVAVSLAIPAEDYPTVFGSKGHQLRPPIRTALEAAARTAAGFSVGLLNEEAPDLVVHNLNFPTNTTATTPLRRTVPARVSLGSLFRYEGNGQYTFQYGVGVQSETDTPTDRDVISRGEASWSPLAFGNIGMP